MVSLLRIETHGFCGRLLQGVYNVFFHPLRRFPGPLLARSSVWWRVWVEVFRGESWVRVLGEVHGVYGLFGPLFCGVCFCLILGREKLVFGFGFG